jgi:hypothetical protein
MPDVLRDSASATWLSAAAKSHALADEAILKQRLAQEFGRWPRCSGGGRALLVQNSPIQNSELMEL